MSKSKPKQIGVKRWDVRPRATLDAKHARAIAKMKARKHGNSTTSRAQESLRLGVHQMQRDQAKIAFLLREVRISAARSR